MYKRKREINTSELLKEINEFKKSKKLRNKKEIYDSKTLNIKDYKNLRNKEYKTKTMRTCITSFNDFDIMNKEIKKRKNKGRFDIGSHRNKDIFIEADSDQYNSGYNLNENKNYNKCSKLLIDKITPYVSEHYLTQNNINPYYSIKTYNNFNIKRPFNEHKKRINKKSKKEENILNKTHDNIKSNNLSSSSNKIIKYPLVISLKTKNNNHIPQNSNISNYFNDGYFITISDNSNITGEKNNKNEEEYIHYSNDNLKSEDEINKIEKDYKVLYLKKEQQYNNLLRDYNNIKNELNKSKDNYIINNFKKLNINRMNNNKTKKIFKDKNIKVIHNINIFYEKTKKKNQILELRNESFNIISNSKEPNKNKIKEDLIMISKISNKKCFNKDNFIINKTNNFKIIVENRKNKLNEINAINNISINLNDILDEINTNYSANLKNNKNIKNGNDKIILTRIKDKKFNLQKFINKNNNISKEESIENNIDRIINKRNNDYKINDIKSFNDNMKEQNHFPIKEKSDLFNDKINDLPDLSYIRNKLKISIIKRKKINEDELNH